MDYIEFEGKTLEDAITNAGVSLGATSDKLEYEIIDKGSSGFLGIGAKPVIIKARKKSDAGDIDLDDIVKSEETARPEKKEKKEKKEFKKEEKAAQKEEKKQLKQEKKEEKKEEKEAKKEAKREEKRDRKKEKAQEAAPEKPREKKPVNPIDVTPTLPKAEEFLTNVCKAMDLDVKVEAKVAEEPNSIYVDVAGDNMGMIIGKRGQTLDALQYLTSIVVNEDMPEYVRVKLDTENYRERRKATLENLAKNMANKVKRTNRAVTLDPMNPYERRIIHSALQKIAEVDTHSEGDEPYRKVVITPVKRKRGE